MKYFIMLNHPCGRPVPLCVDVDHIEEAALFDSEWEAEKFAGQHGAAQAWGYTVFEWSWA